MQLAAGHSAPSTSCIAIASGSSAARAGDHVRQHVLAGDHRDPPPRVIVVRPDVSDGSPPLASAPCHGTDRPTVPPGLRPARRSRRGAADLDTAVAGLDDAGWATPTPAAGWDVATRSRTSRSREELAAIALTDAAAFARRLADVARGPGRHRRRRSWTAAGRSPGADVLAWWRISARRRPSTGFERTDAPDRVPWIIGAMSAAIVRDRATHGDLGARPDVRRRARDRDPLRRRGYATSPTSAFAPVRSATPFAASAARRPTCVSNSTGPDGDTWTWGEHDRRRARRPAIDFCRVVTQRRRPDDTALVVTGPPRVSGSTSPRRSPARRPISARRQDTARFAADPTTRVGADRTTEFMLEQRCHPNERASSAGRPTTCTPTGSPRRLSASGSEIAGCPVVFHNAVNGVSAQNSIIRSMPTSAIEPTGGGGPRDRRRDEHVDSRRRTRPCGATAPGARRTPSRSPTALDGAAHLDERAHPRVERLERRVRREVGRGRVLRAKIIADWSTTSSA